MNPVAAASYQNTQTAPAVTTDRRLRVIAGSNSGSAAVLQLLDTTPIRVVLPTGTPQWRHQVLALALVDLLGRLFPTIIIDVDPDAAAHPDLPPGAALLEERLRAAAANGDLTPAAHADRPPVTVVIGAGTPFEDHQGLVLHVDAGGWQSYNGTDRSRLADGVWPAIAIGALAAACRAAGQATAAALASVAPTRAPEPSAYASALTHRCSTDPLDESHEPAASSNGPVLNAVLVGAGSIGGATAYSLTMTPGLSGHLVITDPQLLEDKNVDRALLATAATTAARWPKATAAEAALAHHVALRVEGYVGTVAEWVATRPRDSPLPLVLTAVDSAIARRSVQDCLPLDLVNAACHPDEITVSGHRTGDGPCVCCLHMEQVLDAENIKIRLLARATGINERMIAQFLVQDVPLATDVLRHIERHRHLPAGALDRYENLTLEHLRAAELIYGATEVSTANGRVAVAAPFVTALAGVLLAAELLKHADPQLHLYRLGPDGGHIKYEENRYAGPLHAMCSRPTRWPTSECLCRSTRRQRIIAGRYQLTAEPFNGDPRP